MIEHETDPMSDRELDAILGAAHADLGRAVETSTDVEAGLSAIVSRPRPGAFSQSEINDLLSKGA